MESAELEIELSDGFGNKIQFLSLHDLELFFQAEQERWQWVNERHTTRNGAA
jgi:hypothetical protein